LPTITDSVANVMSSEEFFGRLLSGHIGRLLFGHAECSASTEINRQAAESIVTPTNDPTPTSGRRHFKPNRFCGLTPRRCALGHRQRIAGPKYYSADHVEVWADAVWPSLRSLVTLTAFPIEARL